MISILIPTFNNINYLKLTVESIKKNSSYKNHEILLHINDGSDGTLDYAIVNNISYTHSKENVGLCTAINTVGKIAKSDLLLYAHDDMYFCPNWDSFLLKEVNLLNHNLYYFSGTMIEQKSGHISYDCGKNYVEFDEKKLLDNYKKLSFYDHQGFNPGIGSDPDFNMKLWKENVRIFKGISKFRVYHFSSITTRKKGLKQNKGDLTFLKKWNITTKFFKKYFLRSNTKYTGPLPEPDKTFFYHLGLFVCFLKRINLIVFNK
jgi:glycosyltransferase involved in cell wall biosynthesis